MVEFIAGLFIGMGALEILSVLGFIIEILVEWVLEEFLDDMVFGKPYILVA